MYLYEPDSFTPLARLEQTLEEPAHITLGPDGEFTEHPVKTTHATHFYQNDHLGTPQELVDGEGEIVWLGKYRAWGELRSATQKDGQPAKIRNALRFQGQYCDDETGLHYNLNRYYDPASGRFINKDPIGLRGGINLFKYAPNPVQWVDPLGLAVGDGGQTTGIDRPLAVSTPDSIYTKTDASGSVAVQNTIYGPDGTAIGQVDFKRHGCACSGHGHELNPPGDFRSAHGSSAPHFPPEDVPSGWSTIPDGIAPAQPIGK